MRAKDSLEELATGAQQESDASCNKLFRLAGYASTPANTEVVVEVPANVTENEVQWLKENLQDADVDWDIDINGEICDAEWDHIEVMEEDRPTHRLVREADGTLRIVKMKEEER